MLIARDIPILDWLSKLFLMNRRLVQRLCFPDDKEGRVARRRLNALVQGGFIKRRTLMAVSPGDGSSAPTYHLTKQGREFLAAHFSDPTLLLLPIEPKQPLYLLHYLAVAETVALFQQAMEQTEEISMSRFVLEDHVVNIDEPNAASHFSLEYVTQTPVRKIVCDPDGAFELRYKESRAVFYLEQDRDRNQWQGRVASKKNPGFEYLFNKKLHRMHFPDNPLPYFFVLFITPTPRRRDQLRKAFAHQNKDKEFGKFFRFAAFPDLQEAVNAGRNLFFEPLFFRPVDDEPVALIKK